MTTYRDEVRRRGGYLGPVLLVTMGLWLLIGLIAWGMLKALAIL